MQFNFIAVQCFCVLNSRIFQRNNINPNIIYKFIQILLVNLITNNAYKTLWLNDNDSEVTNRNTLNG